jgi:hypothetical protein
MKAAWFREWEEFMATFHTPNTTENFLDFMLHFDVADRSKLRKWHRSRYSVDEETAAYNALSAALQAESAAPVGRGTFSPPTAPARLTAGASAQAASIRRDTLETIQAIEIAKAKVKEFALSGLSESDIMALRLLRNNSLADVTLVDIHTYVDDTYNLPNPAQISARHSQIKAQFDRSMPLSLNFAVKLDLNQSLKDVAEHRAFTPTEMYDILVDTCREHSPRLRAFVDKFRDRDGYDESDTDPKPFIKFIVEKNKKHLHEPGTGHLVFADEMGYKPSGAHPLALATTADSPPPVATAATPPSPPALALAATPAPALTSADIAALIQALTAQALASPPKRGRQQQHRIQSYPQAATLQPVPRCKFCFACGFQRDHNSRSVLCPKMANDPSYTATHRSMVYFPPGTNPLIEGKRANLTCAPGCVPHP